MPIATSPIRLLALLFATLLNRELHDAIELLREENRILRGLLGKRRIRFTDAQRRRLAVLGKAVGRALLADIVTLVTPETILAWHRRLVALKWTFAGGARGNAAVMKKITMLVVRMARENVTWGYDRLQGALANLGHVVAPNTIRNILLRNGIEPAPERGKRTPWKTFLKAHAKTLAAGDFFTTEVWTLRGLVTHHTIFVIDHATRAVKILGTAVNPGEVFMKQMAILLTDPIDGALRGKRFLIIDRDAKFTAAFRQILKDSGIRILLTPPSAPNCNAVAERWVRSVREEVLTRMIFFGTPSLDRALAAYEAHFRTERNHQGIENVLIEPDPGVGSTIGAVQRRERLGGLLSYYHRSAA